jgi:hypothetical protein
MAKAKNEKIGVMARGLRVGTVFVFLELVPL